MGEWDGELLEKVDCGKNSFSLFLLLVAFWDTLWPNGRSCTEPLMLWWCWITLVFDELTEIDEDVMLPPPLVDKEDGDGFNTVDAVLLTA